MFTVVAVDTRLEPLLKDYLPLYETGAGRTDPHDSLEPPERQRGERAAAAGGTGAGTKRMADPAGRAMKMPSGPATHLIPTEARRPWLMCAVPRCSATSRRRSLSMRKKDM